MLPFLSQTSIDFFKASKETTITVRKDDGRMQPPTGYFPGTDPAVTSDRTTPSARKHSAPGGKPAGGQEKRKRDDNHYHGDDDPVDLVSTETDFDDTHTQGGDTTDLDHAGGRKKNGGKSKGSKDNHTGVVYWDDQGVARLSGPKSFHDQYGMQVKVPDEKEMTNKIYYAKDQVGRALKPTPSDDSGIQPCNIILTAHKTWVYKEMRRELGEAMTKALSTLPIIKAILSGTLCKALAVRSMRFADPTLPHEDDHLTLALFYNGGKLENVQQLCTAMSNVHHVFRALAGGSNETSQLSDIQQRMLFPTTDDFLGLDFAYIHKAMAKTYYRGSIIMQDLVTGASRKGLDVLRALTPAKLQNSFYLEIVRPEVDQESFIRDFRETRGVKGLRTPKDTPAVTPPPKNPDGKKKKAETETEKAKEKDRKKKNKGTGDLPAVTPTKLTLATIDASKLCVRDSRWQTGDTTGGKCEFGALCRFDHYSSLPKGTAKTLLTDAYTLVIKDPKARQSAIEFLTSDKFKDPKKRFA